MWAWLHAKTIEISAFQVCFFGSKRVHKSPMCYFFVFAHSFILSSSLIDGLISFNDVMLLPVLYSICPTWTMNVMLWQMLRTKTNRHIIPISNDVDIKQK